MRTSKLPAICFIASCLFCLPPAWAQSSSDSHAEAARALLTALRAEARVAQLRQALAEQQVQRDKRLAEYRTQINAYMNKYMGWEVMREDIVAGYKSKFTEAELREILAFFESQTGKKALEHMEGVIRDVSRARAQVLQENSGELRDSIMNARKSSEPKSGDSQSGQPATGAAPKSGG